MGGSRTVKLVDSSLLPGGVGRPERGSFPISREGSAGVGALGEVEEGLGAWERAGERAGDGKESRAAAEAIRSACSLKLSWGEAFGSLRRMPFCPFDALRVSRAGRPCPAGMACSPEGAAPRPEEGGGPSGWRLVWAVVPSVVLAATAGAFRWRKTDDGEVAKGDEAINQAMASPTAKGASLKPEMSLPR